MSPSSKDLIRANWKMVGLFLLVTMFPLSIHGIQPKICIGIFDHVRVDFTPVYQCLHIHDMLSLRAQFQQYYSENRKVGHC